MNNQSDYRQQPPTPQKQGNFGNDIWIKLLGLFIVCAVIVGATRMMKSKANEPVANQPTTSTAAPTLPPTINGGSTLNTNENTSSFKAGYQKGFLDGKKWAKEVKGGGMPMRVGIKFMASNLVKNAKPSDEELWVTAYEEGFVNGYQGIRPPLIKAEKLEYLSWDNAKPNVKLYKHDGQYAVTIVAVDRASGLITVQYPSSRGGVIEDKKLDSLADIWFVRK